MPANLAKPRPTGRASPARLHGLPLGFQKHAMLEYGRLFASAGRSGTNKNASAEHVRVRSAATDSFAALPSIGVEGHEEARGDSHGEHGIAAA